MTNRMRVTLNDRLTINAQTYRLQHETETGYAFECSEGDGPQIHLSYHEFEALLSQSDVVFEPGFFLIGQIDARLNADLESLHFRRPEVCGRVVWRYAWVSVAAHFATKHGMKKTDHSIKEFMPQMEAHVNELARASRRKWRAPRAGRKSQFRDPPCSKTLRTWMKRYERGDCSYLALVPRTHRSGNKNDRFCLVSTRLLGDCVSAYLTRKRLSKKQVADLCKLRFTKLNADREAEGKPALRIPSRRAVERAIARLDPYFTFVQRHSVEAANRKFALYETGISASYPMERIEIDEWKVDLISILAARGALDNLSDEELAQLDRGRRWLYLAIDCATRCVVGMRLAATPNSEDAYALLSDVTRDKTDLAIAAGCQSTWHHFGGLGTVCTDNGAAFVDDLFSMSILEAHGHPDTPPGGLPHLRGRVERIFGTFGTTLMPHLAGRTFSNTQDRGDYPSEKLATLTDDTLMQILTLYVVDVYHNTPHRGLHGETPNNCWARLSKEKGIVPKLTETTRRRAFGQRERRKVSGRGVELFGINYACPALQDFFLHSHDQEVEIRVSLEDLGWVLVHVDGKWHPAHALQKCFEGVCYDDWQDAARELRLKYKADAQLHEHVVAAAIVKIIEINSREQRRFDTVLKAQTPAGLRRAHEDLFVGLTIIPDQSEEFDLSPEPDLFGHIIPEAAMEKSQEIRTKSDTAGGNQNRSGRSGDWSFDDDE